LLVVLAYRPELLVLDEPSTGLDPVVRREILGAIIRSIAVDGRTVVFSSHLLDEVERVSDYVAMIDRGRIVLSGPLDEVKGEHRRVTLHFDSPLDRPPMFRGMLFGEGFGKEWSGVCVGSVEEAAAEAAQLGARIIESHTPSLDEILVARVNGRRLVAAEV
jgi:ABC-2 type transport system ATP-binding protein